MTTFGIALTLKLITLGFILAMLATVSIGTHIFVKMFAK